MPPKRQTSSKKVNVEKIATTKKKKKGQDSAIKNQKQNATVQAKTTPKSKTIVKLVEDESGSELEIELVHDHDHDHEQESKLKSKSLSTPIQPKIKRRNLRHRDDDTIQVETIEQTQHPKLVLHPQKVVVSDKDEVTSTVSKSDQDTGKTQQMKTTLSTSDHLGEYLLEFQIMYRLYLESTINQSMENGLPPNAHYAGESVSGMYYSLFDLYGSKLPELLPNPNQFDSMDEKALRCFIFAQVFLKGGQGIVGIDTTEKRLEALRIFRQVTSAKATWFSSILESTGDTIGLDMLKYRRTDEEQLMTGAWACSDRSALWCNYKTDGDGIENDPVTPANRCKSVIRATGKILPAASCRIDILYLHRLAQELKAFAMDMTATRGIPIVPVDQIYRDVFKMWQEDYSKQSNSGAFLTLPSPTTNLTRNKSLMLIYLYATTRDEYNNEWFFSDFIRWTVEPGFTIDEQKALFQTLQTSGHSREHLRIALRNMIYLINNRVGRVAWNNQNVHAWFPKWNNLGIIDRRNLHADAVIAAENQKTLERNRQNF